MDWTGIEKVKVSHAVVVFLIIINCLGLPVILLCLTDLTLFLKIDLLKTVLICGSVGCAQFAFACGVNNLKLDYLNRVSRYKYQQRIKKQGKKDDAIWSRYRRFLIERSLVRTSVFQIYYFIAFSGVVLYWNFNSRQVIITLFIANALRVVGLCYANIKSRINLWRQFKVTLKNGMYFKTLDKDTTDSSTPQSS